MVTLIPKPQRKPVIFDPQPIINSSVPPNTMIMGRGGLGKVLVLPPPTSSERSEVDGGEDD